LRIEASTEKCGESDQAAAPSDGIHKAGREADDEEQRELPGLDHVKPRNLTTDERG
jgi:hypothetical protein